MGTLMTPEDDYAFLYPPRLSTIAFAPQTEQPSMPQAPATRVYLSERRRRQQLVRSDGPRPPLDPALAVDSCDARGLLQATSCAARQRAAERRWWEHLESEPLSRANRYKPGLGARTGSPPFLLVFRRNLVQALLDERPGSDLDPIRARSRRIRPIARARSERPVPVCGNGTRRLPSSSAPSSLAGTGRIDSVSSGRSTRFP